MYGDAGFSTEPKRTLILRPMEGEKAKTTTGMVDSRLFKGENELYAVMDRQSNLWSFRYKIGGIPEQLKGSWTRFQKAEEVAREYFKQRNIEIVEIKRD